MELTFATLLLLVGLHAPITPMPFSVSAYCDVGITNSGTWVRPGITACGPSYPFGTVFAIQDGPVVVCADRGGLVTDRHLDIWMPSCEDAILWGRREMFAIALNQKDMFPP
jgi:3D (Asp-Asp-Asp) domain-containing protein